MNKKYISILILIIAGGFNIRYGIIPAWNDINSDFPNYYTSSRLLIEGKDISKIYDDNWFEQQIKNYRINETGKFSPFPPPTIFVMVPFSIFESITAKRLFLIINIIILLWTALIFRKISALNYINCLNIILISGAAIINNFILGQLYLLLLFAIVMGYFYLSKEDEYQSGYIWGIGAAIKYFPIIYVPILIVKKKWRGLISLLLTIIMINIITLIITGYDIYIQFIKQVLFSHLNGELSSQSKYAVQFQSWNSLLRILFIEDSIENNIPLFNSPIVFMVVRILIYLIIISTSTFIIYKVRDNKNFLPYSSIILTLAALLLSPASATYHLLISAFPLILLLSLTQEGNKGKYGITFLLIYILIGYLPFVNSQFLKENLFFSFYRLWLLVIFFITAARFILTNSRQCQ